MKNPPPLQIAIAGAGLMGRWHAEAGRQAGGTVTAVLDSNEHAAQQLAGRFQRAKPFTGLEQLLVAARPNILHICTPLNSHAGLAAAALEAGCHVLVEKPLARTAAETERLLGLAEKQGRLLCPVHQFIFQRGVRQAREELPHLGRILQMNAVIRSAGGQEQPAGQLEAIVNDILPHPLAVFQTLLPAPGLSPTTPWQTDRPGYPEQAGEFWATAQAGETTLRITVSLNGRPTANTLEIVGTAGTLHLDLFHGFAVGESGHVSRFRKIVHPFDLAGRHLTAAAANLARRTWNRQPAYPGLWELVNAFYQAVHQGKPSPISPADTLIVAQIRDRLIHE
jgi:predicted dehydrogenase